MKKVTLKIKKNEELVLIPRKDYEALLRTKKSGSNTDIVVKRSKSFKVPRRHEKFYDELDKELTSILREVEQRKVIGPFSSVSDLKKSLKK